MRHWGRLWRHPFSWRGWRQVFVSRKSLFWIETLGLVLVMGFVCWFSFGRVIPQGSTPCPLTALTIPVFVWSALRFGRRGTTVAVAVFATCAIWGTAHGFGPLVMESYEHSILAAQSNLGLISAAVLLLLAVVFERREAIDEASATEARYRVLFEQSPDAVMVIDTTDESASSIQQEGPQTVGVHVRGVSETAVGRFRVAGFTPSCRIVDGVAISAGVCRRLSFGVRDHLSSKGRARDYCSGSVLVRCSVAAAGLRDDRARHHVAAAGRIAGPATQRRLGPCVAF